MGYAIGYKHIFCDYCNRKLFNKTWATKKGCRFCDAEYHLKKKKETLDN